MEQLENMEEIEALQTELGQFLVSIIPVPWKKICFYVRCAQGYSETWFAFIEKETDVICVQDFFWDRYQCDLPKRMIVFKKFGTLSKSLYQAYLGRFGAEKMWQSVYYTVEADGTVHIDFGYEQLPGTSIEQYNAVYRKFFGTEYQYYRTKYPSTERK